MTAAGLWQSVTHVGVPENTPPRKARYVILLNSLIVLATPVTFVYLAMNLTTDLPLVWQLTPPLGVLFGYAITLVLNYRRRYQWALIWLILYLTAYVAATSFAFGAESGSYLFLIAVLATTALLCPPHYPRTATLLLTTVLLTFLGIVFFGDRITPAITPDRFPLEGYFQTALVAVAALTALIAHHSHRRGAALESSLENAADAIEHEGEIRIRVTDKDDAVTVEFVDNGKGIAAASLPTLFDFGLSPKRGRVGMRLGLPMSRFSVEEMGGTLAIASVEGEGTAVTIELPAMKP